VYTFRGITEPGCTVEVGGRYFADVDADGDWTLELLLRPGGNATTFTATDEAGLMSNAQVKVVLAEAVTTTTSPVVEAPAACKETPVGLATFADIDEYRLALVGRWLFCDITSESGDYDYDRPLGIEGDGVIGVVFLPANRYQHLAGPIDAPIALTGWGNEGTYIVLDKNETRTAYQVNIKRDGDLGTHLTFIEFSTDLRFMSVLIYGGPARHVRIPD
jgi:hypothetical protein